MTKQTATEKATYLSKVHQEPYLVIRLERDDYDYVGEKEFKEYYYDFLQENVVDVVGVGGIVNA